MYNANNNGKELVELVIQLQKEKGAITWDIETEQHLNERFRDNSNGQAWKKRYYRAKKKNKQTYQSLTKETLSSKTSYNASNQEYIIEAEKLVRKGELITPESIAIEKGYDLRYFEIVGFKHSVSNGTSSKSPTGEWNAEHFSVRVKQREAVDFTKEDLEEIVKKFNYKHKPNEIVPSNKQSTMIYFFTDTHIGAINQDGTWNLEIAERNITTVIEKMRLHILKNNPQKVIVVFLGDFINYDNAGYRTTKGTEQLGSSNPYNMLDVAVTLSHRVVERLCIAPKNKVYFLYGNHDKVLSYAMFKPLPYAFRNSKNIEFEINKKERTAFMVGDTGIFLLHGDMPDKRKFGWASFDFPQVYANSKERYIIQGHLHNFNLKIETDKGLTLITLPSLQLQSDFEHRQGYANYPLAVGLEINKGLECFEIFKV